MNTEQKTAKEPKRLRLPATEEEIRSVRVGDMLLLDGFLYTGRDAVLPRLTAACAKPSYCGPDLRGSAVFHTAVSPAGVGPTSSNKLEILQSMVPLAKQGVLMHIGKGALDQETVHALCREGAVYAVTPPVTALFNACIEEREVVFGADLGMEAMNRLNVHDFPVIIAAAGGESLYEKR